MNKTRLEEVEISSDDTWWWRLCWNVGYSFHARRWLSWTRLVRQGKRTAAWNARSGCVTATDTSVTCVYSVYSQNRSSRSTHPYPAATHASLVSVPCRQP